MVRILSAIAFFAAHDILWLRIGAVVAFYNLGRWLDRQHWIYIAHTYHPCTLHYN
jgi:hypothetical protein